MPENVNEEQVCTKTIENGCVEENQPNVVVPDEKKPKKRGRKPNPEKRTGYFYEEEEKAFKEYIQSDDQNFRNKIFKEKLFPAFTKMIESISRRYGLYTPSESFDDTFYDTMSFLMTKVNNFDFTKGYKAYSYCGTVCKRYLLLKRTQDMKRTENVLSYDTVFDGAKQDMRQTDDNEDSHLYYDLINKTIDEITYMVSDEYPDKMTENERNVGYALLEILTNWEEIFTRIETKKFNKTSVYYFIREFTLLSSKEVREAMKKYKNLYFFQKQKMIEE